MTHYKMARVWVLLILATLVSLPSVAASVPIQKAPVDYVDPFIGTDAFPGPAPWGALGGTYPGAVAPFGMAQPSPETKIGAEPRGYYYRDNRIKHFSMVNHVSGYPNGSEGDICLMPVIAETVDSAGDYDSSFSHSQESASPGYYEVVLKDYGIQAEFTVAERTSLCKFTFPESENAKILLYGVDTVKVVGNEHVEGRKGNFHFWAEFSKPFDSYGAYKDGVFLSYRTHDGEPILVKMGFSSVSSSKAARNAEAEIPDWDFETVRARARDLWNENLSKIEVEGGTEDEKTIFYTALYHSLLLPHVFSDVDGEYRGFDNQVHRADDYVYYYRFSPWDTFRSEHPLLTLLQPTRESDMIRSLLNQYERSGWLPTGPMSGNHAIPIIVDSYLKGITGFDVEKAYEAMRKSVMQPPYTRQDMSTYVALGYVPAEIPESVTKTLEYAYNDWVLAQFARLLGKEADYTELMKRAGYYRNVFNPSTRFMMARRTDGTWTEVGGFEEGDKWSYSWFVPHDLWGLVNLMGGPDEYNSRLEEAKTHYYHDNEPIEHYAYLFNYSGAPWKTQEWVRDLMAANYNTSAGGLPGMDDLGAMSSWYVFSAMGFFPVCPGRPVYDIGSPVFDRVTIHLDSGKTFVVEAKGVSRENKYIQAASLNGKPLDQPWINHAEVASGGKLVLEMGPRPNHLWGNGPDFVAPSMTRGRPSFEYTGIELPSTEIEVGTPVPICVTVENKGDTPGCAELRLYVDGKQVSSTWVVVDAGDRRKVEVTATLYEAGRHEVTVNSLKPCVVTVVEGVPF